MSPAFTVTDTARAWLCQVDRDAVRFRDGSFYIDGVEATAAEAHELRGLIDSPLVERDGDRLWLTVHGRQALGATR